MNFTKLPAELQPLIFEFLDSKDRSVTCSVSKTFYNIAISVSTSLSKYSELYDSENKEIILTKTQIKEILITGDYHLIVRLKNRYLFNLQFGCLGGYLFVVKLLIEKGAGNWSDGMYGACLGGHLSVIELISKSAFTLSNIWNNGLYVNVDVFL